MGVGYPVFAYAGVFVKLVLFGEVFRGGTFRKNFDDPVWSSLATSFVDLSGVANDTDIGLYNSVDLIAGLPAWGKRQANVERRGENLTGLTDEIIGDEPKQVARKPLMRGTGRGRHSEHLTPDEFDYFVKLPVKVVGISVPLAEIELINIGDHTWFV